MIIELGFLFSFLINALKLFTIKQVQISTD